MENGVATTGPTKSSDARPDVTWGVSLAAGVAGLTVLLLVGLPLFCWWGVARYGEIGGWAAGLAVGICWGGGLLGMVVASLFRGVQAANGVLLGMLIRMMLPLGVGLVLTAGGAPVAQAGLMGMLTVCYLVALVFETTWSVRRVRAVQSTSKVV